MTRTVPVDTIPVYGREGFLLPLGPEVQHTGELTAGAAPNEVWAFGIPRHDLELPGLHLELQHPRGQTWLLNLPGGTTVRLFGRGSAEVSNRGIRFWARSRTRKRQPPG
jgi:alpha-D-xyloside xylohydrolase